MPEIGPKLPFIRGWRLIDVSAEDYVDEDGFLIYVYDAGDISYSTSLDDNIVETDTVEEADLPAAVGLGKGAAAVPAICSKVYSAATTCTEIRVGIF